MTGSRLRTRPYLAAQRGGPPAQLVEVGREVCAAAPMAGERGRVLQVERCVALAGRRGQDVDDVSSFAVGLDLDLEVFVFQGSGRSDASAAGLGLLPGKDTFRGGDV